MFRTLKRFRKGDALTSAKLNELVDAINQNQVTAGPGLKAFVSTAGTYLCGIRPARGQVAYTTSSITARSGTTAGSGTATLQFLSSTTITTTGIPDVTAYSYSATAIASGKYCWVQQDTNGTWWVISVEC